MKKLILIISIIQSGLTYGYDELKIMRPDEVSVFISNKNEIKFKVFALGALRVEFSDNTGFNLCDGQPIINYKSALKTHRRALLDAVNNRRMISIDTMIKNKENCKTTIMIRRTNLVY